MAFVEEDYFGISSETGMLYSKNSLRGASSKSPYKLVVKAQDKGSPVLMSTTIVHINVSSGQLDNGKPIWISPRFGDSNAVTITNITEVSTITGLLQDYLLPFEQVCSYHLNLELRKVVRRNTNSATMN